MKKVGIFFGSSSGTTEDIAGRIAGKLGVSGADIYNVGSVEAAAVQNYDVLLLGSSTWGAGDLQDDWYDFLPKLRKEDLSGKLVALFGCGDSSSFGDTFCDALGTIYADLKDTGCQFIGRTALGGYSFDGSSSVVNGEFIGLALDEMNESDLTEGRLDAWIARLKDEGLE